MHLMGARLCRPVDHPALKVIEASGLVRITRFVRCRVAEEASLPTEFAPLLVDGAVHLVGIGFRRPVDRAALEVVETPVTVGASRLVGGGVANGTSLGVQRAPLLMDRTVHL